MIKDNFLERVIDVFQQHEKFDYIDFKIDIKEGVLQITYLIEPKFQIIFNDKNHFEVKKEGAPFDISGEACPGKFSVKENFLLIKKSDVYVKIHDWLDSIWKEISSESPLSLLVEEQEKVEQICEKFNYVEGYFTTDELLQIDRKLDELKKEFGEEVKIMVKDPKLQEFELTKLYNDFDTLKQIAPYLKKKGWIKSFTGRVLYNSRRLFKLQQKTVLNHFSEINQTLKNKS